MLLGTNQVNKKLKDTIKVIAKTQTEGLIEIGERGVKILKLNTPVDSGRLRNSMSYTIDKNSIDPLGADEPDDKLPIIKSKSKVIIGTNVIYAPSVEFLSQNGSAGFMLRSYKQLKPISQKIIQTIFKRKGF